MQLKKPIRIRGKLRHAIGRATLAMKNNLRQTPLIITPFTDIRSFKFYHAFDMHACFVINNTGSKPASIDHKIGIDLLKLVMLIGKRHLPAIHMTF